MRILGDPGLGKAKTQRIALGLAIAEHHARPGVEMPRAVLALFCGCTVNAIALIEQRALRKLRTRLRIGHDPVLRDLMEQLFDARRPAGQKEGGVEI